ncbi:MAG: S8 family serine peptidase [Candidatus Thermoplasmatota archaeon]|nr:S8 family serine peptidase [Candidatus Thermoplasmatota archaeon]
MGATSAFEREKGSEKKIVQVRITGSEDISTLNRLDVDILERYESYGLIEADQKTIEELDSIGFQIDELPGRTEVSVKGHTFDILEGEDDLDPELTKSGYSSGTEGLYVVHMIGPVHPEWRDTLEGEGIEILNYVPNYAYEVRMTPEQRDRVDSLNFVDWTGVYHPGYKISEKVKEGLKKYGSGKVRVNLVEDPDFDYLNEIQDIDLDAEFSESESGIKTILEVDDFSSIIKMANMNDVYFISPYLEPELHGEMDSQIIGGGCWFMDDYSDPADGEWREGDPNEAYRKYGDHGAYINQRGYTGEGVTITVADTGLGDGTVGNAGHPDLNERVIGGYSFGSDPESWEDGHGHGTHTTGSVAADGYGGTGETFNFADYYKAQGLSSDSDIFATRIFDGGGSFMPSEYYPIVEEPAQRSDAYIHSNSWGSSSEGSYSEADQVFDQAVRDADRDAEGNQQMVITASAGNDGTRGDQTIGSPATGKNVITVGATRTYNTEDGFENAELMADFSSRGWTEDPRVKPTVVAPGEGIYSLTPDGGYTEMSGTSMSNPAVAGAAGSVVDWYQQNYEKGRPSPAMVKALLVNTAVDLRQDFDSEQAVRDHIPNKDEGWGLVDLSKLEYPIDRPVPFTAKDQETLIQTGDVKEYNIAPGDYSKDFNITLTWTDKNAEAGDSEGGTPVLKNDLTLEVETPSGDFYVGNSFNKTGEGNVSDSGYTYPGVDTYSDFDTTDDGLDNVNNVENVFIPSEDLEMGSYTVRVIGTNVPADANNDGNANQDFALAAYNTKPSSDGMISIEEERYSSEDNVNMTVIDGDLQDEVSLEVGIRSDTDPDGINVTLSGDEETYDFSGQVTVSESDAQDVLQVSHGDTITAEYWDQNTGERKGVVKESTAYIDGMPPESPTQLEVDWWAKERSEVWYDDVSGNLGYTTGTSHQDASEWAVRQHGSAVGSNSWDWGDGQFNKNSSAGMKSWLISPEIPLPQGGEDQLGIELTFQHWKDFGDSSLYDAGNLKISTNGSDGKFELLKPKEGYDGTINDEYGNPLGGQPGWGGTTDWGTVTVDLSAYAGETINLRWDAATEAYSGGEGEGWRIDDITVNEVIKGTDHNKLTWTASVDDMDAPYDDPNGHVVRYDIHRAAEMSGPWDESTIIQSVEADRSDSYSFVDENRGENDGERWWYVVRAVKDVGNKENNEMTVPEPGGPQIDMIKPKDGQIFTKTEVTLEWTGSANINRYEIRLNQGDLIDVGTSTEHTLTGLEDKTHMASVFGYTDAEMGYASQNFIVDTTAPELEVDTPKDGGYISESDVTVEWEGLDKTSGIDHYDIRIDGGNWTNVEKNTSYTFPGLEHGESYTVDVRALDRASFSTMKTVSFTIDLVKPDIDILYPEDDKWGAIDLTTTWEGTDEVSGLDRYEVRIDEGDWKDIGLATEYDFTNLSVESHTIELKASDVAGNSNVTNTTFQVDPKRPDLNIVSPSMETTFETNKVTIAWSGVDEHSGLSHIDVRLDDADWKEVGISSAYTFTGLEEGTHTVEVRATDRTYQESSDTVSFTVDTTPPDLSITSPDQESIFDENDVTIEWESGDETSGISRYQVRKDYSEWIDVDDATSHEFEGLEEGEHFVEVLAEDEAGHTTTEMVRFSVDTTQPELSILTPSNGTLHDKDDLNAIWTGNDDGSGIDHYEVRIDQGEWKDVGSSSFYEFKDLEDGEHEIEVRAVDRAGLQTTESVGMTLDSTEPEVAITSPEIGASGTGNTVTIEWTSDDEASGVDNYEIRLDNGEWRTADSENSHTLEGLEDGDHTVEVRVEDAAGNTNVETINFSTTEDAEEDSGISSFWLIPLIAIIVILVLALFFMNKGGAEEEPAGSFEEMEEVDGPVRKENETGSEQVGEVEENSQFSEDFEEPSQPSEDMEESSSE